MKKILYTALACAFFSSSQTVFAQQTIEKEIPERNNIVKLNLSSLALKNGSMQYERIVSPKMSFALGVSYMPKTGLPFASKFSDKIGNNTDVQNAIATTRFGSYSVTPEYRFYLGKKEGAQGFYIAPFGRYLHTDIEMQYTFTAFNGKSHTFLINGNTQGIGGGVLLGAQWQLSDALSLDWWIAGPLIGSAKGNLSSIDDFSYLTDADKAKLEKEIESIDLPMNKLNATVSSNRVDATLKGTYAGIRAFGLVLGMRF